MDELVYAWAFNGIVHIVAMDVPTCSIAAFNFWGDPDPLDRIYVVKPDTRLGDRLVDVMEAVA